MSLGLEINPIGFVSQYNPQMHHDNDLLKILTYDYNWKDTTINLLVVVSQIVAFALSSASGSLNLGTFFWLTCAFLILMIQVAVCWHLKQLGFSSVWCVLAGLMLYEQLRWHVFGRTLPLIVSASVCAALTGLAVVYYMCEELCLPDDGSQVLPDRCSTCEPFVSRLGTTAVHLAVAPLGAGLGALADAAGDARFSWFIATITMGAVVGLLLGCCMRRSSHVVAARSISTRVTI